MGKALIIPNVSFATNNLGQITFVDGKLRSITIVGPDSISGVSTYTVSYYPQNTEYTGVEWTVLSGNATIDLDTGVLTPSADGTVVIQALSTHDQSIVATKTISVSIVVPLTSISIYGSDSIDSTSTYSVIYNPQNTTQTGVTWSVLSGPATITQAGVLTPSDNGTVVIKATSTHNAQVVATKTITVSMEIPVTSISIVGNSLISGLDTYSIAYNPSNTTQQGVTWSVVSGNATITQQGVLTASDSGEVVIQAVSTYNVQVVATKTVTVSMVVPLIGMSIDGDTEIEGETTYSVTYNPTNTTETGVTWEVVSGSATITQGGVLTPSGDGEIVIRATSTANPSISASKTVTMDSAHHYEQDYFTIESLEDNNTIKIKSEGNRGNVIISFSTDNGETWDDVTTQSNVSIPLTTLNVGDKVLIKRNAASSWGDTGNKGIHFETTKQFKAYGNTMSLVYGDNFIGKTEHIHNFELAYLFYECTKLVDISNLILPATTLRAYSYGWMFEYCSSLTSVPSDLLPATTLANSCYSHMFDGCSLLTNVPNLPAMTLFKECYYGMFKGCTSLTSIPTDLLPATTIANSCYREMFDRCSSLTNVPNLLPATTLATDCYRSMFNMCASLTSVPANLLPATTLAESCYRYMFCDCGNIVDAPVLPAPTLVNYCYHSMFSCDGNIENQNFKLESIVCLATSLSATDALKNWVSWTYAQSSISNGTFTKAAGVTWPTGGNGIPTGWTVEDYVEPSNNE